MLGLFSAADQEALLQGVPWLPFILANQHSCRTLPCFLLQHHCTALAATAAAAAVAAVIPPLVTATVVPLLGSSWWASCFRGALGPMSHQAPGRHPQAASVTPKLAWQRPVAQLMLMLTAQHPRPATLCT